MAPSAVHGWLLDTHALLWMLYGDSRLTKAAQNAIDGELPLAYSTVSFWEIALKRGRKGFDFFIEEDWDILLPRELHRISVIRWDLEPSDCRALESLPDHHNDPFDRILIAQARERRFGILTRDNTFQEYPVLTLW